MEVSPTKVHSACLSSRLWNIKDSFGPLKSYNFKIIYNFGRIEDAIDLVPGIKIQE